MTIQEHIKFLVDQADDDLGATEVLQKAGYYAHVLFWGHLVLEKMCKAIYLKSNNRIDYPYIHNLLVLLKKSNIELSEGQIMNSFQAKGRYADILHEIEATVSKEVCGKYLDKLKVEMTWLKKQLQ
jgi:HEPN domain-containing protein